MNLRCDDFNSIRIQVVVHRLSSECDDVRPILPKNENAQNFGFFSVENGGKLRLFSFLTKNTENEDSSFLRKPKIEKLKI